MAFVTDRKRVMGLGAARTGTEAHWAMTVSSVGLLLLIPLFVLTFGRALGGSHEEVLAHFSRPYPAIVTALTIAVSFMHFKNGVRVLLEDYVHGLMREVLIIAMTLLCYVAAAVGVFAVARIAL
ncbi:MAG: succinate dehydrogenase, hydrophobic membrane anchor protein [Pseudomonadota bacterium]